MGKYIAYLLSFGICFIVVFLVYVLIINRKRKEYEEGKKQLEINYLVKRFDLDMRKTKYNKVKWIVTFINSFIISFTFTVIMNIDKYLLKMVIGFFILFALIYSLYEITGRVLKNQENKEEQ